MTITNSKIQVSVRKAESDDRAIISDILTAGFMDDPVSEWIAAEPAERARVFPPAFGVSFDLFQPHGETYLTTDGSGAALWQPPETELLSADELDAFGARMEEACGEYAARWFELDEFFAAHAPSEPHWHLALVAVRPDRQGRGWGSAMLANQLWRLDLAGEAAYLEASTLRSRALYERHGFECFGEIVLPDGPPLWQMWRSPR